MNRETIDVIKEVAMKAKECPPGGYIIRRFPSTVPTTWKAE